MCDDCDDCECEKPDKQRPNDKQVQEMAKFLQILGGIPEFEAQECGKMIMLLGSCG